MFVNLITKSYYSISISAISIDEIINFAIKNKQQYVSLIDKNVMYGAIEFYTKAKKNNLRPIIGLNLTLNNNEIYLIALNNNGYLKLCKISSIINCFPSQDWMQHVTDDLIVISNQEWLKKFNAKNKYLDCDLALHEALFAAKDDYEKYKAIIAIKNNQLYFDVNDSNDLMNKYLWTQQQAQQIFTKLQLDNLANLLQKINLTIPLNQNNYFIKFDPKKDSHELLKARCKQGLIYRIGEKVPQKYIDRIKYELDVIHQLNFDDYFLVVQDYVTYAKQNNIMVGPGRGSVAGSLVSYVLGITNIDPLKYDLIFERFLNKARKSMPDIDVDFMDSRRNEIIDYLQAKYGQQHVAHVITFQKIKLKTGIRDVGRILNIDLKIINLICKKITSDLEKNIDYEIKTNKNLIASINEYPQLFKLAFYLVGLPRQIGLHPAGVVLAQQSLTNLAPLCLSNDNIKIVQYSKEYLEGIGLIKLDILGLSNLSIISDCSEKIRQNSNPNFNLSKINFNDLKVYTMLHRGETVGIFQLESAGMTNIIRKINPKSIGDICDTLALFRPGPRNNISLYLENKNKKENMTFINEKLKDILLPTYGIILYQEQVIQIVQKVANYSLSEADLFRQAISKKKYDDLKQLKSDFIVRAVKNNYQQDEANKIFEYVLKFGLYGFNKSHSISYAIISYQMAYLKTYYPLEFFVCLLTYNNNATDKIITYLIEAKKNKISILPPSLNYSQNDFTIYQNKILFGFNAIKGIGYETIKKIITIRNSCFEKKFINLFDALTKLVNHEIGLSVLQILINGGCFDEFFNNDVPNRTSLLINLENIFKAIKLSSPNYNMLLELKFDKFDHLTKQQIAQETITQTNLLGIDFSINPITIIKKNNSFPHLHSLNEIQSFPSDRKANYLAIVKIIKIKRMKTKKNVNIAWLTLEDETTVTTNVIVFNNILVNNDENTLLEVNNFLLVELANISTPQRKMLSVKHIKKKFIV